MDWTVPLQAAIQKIKNKDYMGALSDLEYVLQLSPTNATAFKWCGVVRYHLGQYYDSIGDLNMFFQFSDQISSSVLRYRAEAKKMVGQYDSAKEDLILALGIKRNHKTFQSLGDVNKLLERYDEALQNLNLADQLHPNDPFTLALRGEVKMMLDRGAEALGDLDRALSIVSSDVHALCVRAELCKCMKRYNEALLDLDIAASIEPENQHVISLRNEVRAMMPTNFAFTGMTGMTGVVPSLRNQLRSQSEYTAPPDPENNTNVISNDSMEVLNDTVKKSIEQSTDPKPEDSKQPNKMVEDRNPN
jgi:tetratricopeptide (TPR) repeat protein